MQQQKQLDFPNNYLYHFFSFWIKNLKEKQKQKQEKKKAKNISKNKLHLICRNCQHASAGQFTHVNCIHVVKVRRTEAKLKHHRQKSKN